MNESGTLSALKAELNKIRSLPKGKRWEYIWEYYRLTVFLAAFAIFFTWMIGSFLVNSLMSTLFPRDPFTMAIATADYSGSDAWLADCLTAIGYDEKEEKFQILTTTPYNDTTDDFLTKTTVWFLNGQPDIFLLDEASYQYLLGQEALADLTEAWPQELQALASGRMVDAHRLDLTGTPFAEAYGLEGEAVYLAMYIHGNGFDRALDLVEYILTEG